MKVNEGRLDRTLRLIAGLIALYLAFKYSFWWLIIALPALLTAATGFCWPYELLGINTAKKNKSKKKKY